MNLGLAVASSPIFVRSLRTAPICKPIAEILIFNRTICLCEENTFLNLLDGKQQRFGLCKAKRIFSHFIPLSLDSTLLSKTKTGLKGSGGCFSLRCIGGKLFARIADQYRDW